MAERLALRQAPLQARMQPIQREEVPRAERLSVPLQGALQER